MIRVVICLTAIGLFCSLSAFSYGKHVSKEWHPAAHEATGYTPADIKALTRLISRSERGPGASRQDIKDLFGRDQ